LMHSSVIINAMLDLPKLQREFDYGRTMFVPVQFSPQRRKAHRETSQSKTMRQFAFSASLR
jgi:hypothetical protein